MNSLLYTFTALLGAACLALPAFSAPAAALPATLKPEPHQRDPYDWNARHEAVKKRNRAVKPEYVMIGDSITHHWGGEPSGDSRKAGEASWEKLFGPHAVTNMGFGFDYVDNAYYRVQNGELAGISPRVIIILLGTNNLGHRKDAPQACADNIICPPGASEMPLFQNPAAGHSAQEGEKPGGAGEADEQAARKAAEWKKRLFCRSGEGSPFLGRRFSAQ